MKTLGTAIALIAAAGVSPAAAEELPRYDPLAYCQGIAEFGGGSAMIFNGCIDQEQRAYDRLKADWAGIAAEHRRYCDGIATFSGAGSYMILSGCIDMESRAAADRPGFKF